MKDDIFRIVKLEVMMIIMTIIFLLAMALILLKLGGEQSGIGICTYIVYLITNMSGGFVGEKAFEKKGIVLWLMLSAIYILVLFIVSLAVKGTDGFSIIPMLKCSLSCMLGGVLGGIFSRMLENMPIKK